MVLYISPGVRNFDFSGTNKSVVCSVKMPLTKIRMRVKIRSPMKRRQAENAAVWNGKKNPSFGRELSLRFSSEKYISISRYKSACLLQPAYIKKKKNKK